MREIINGRTYDTETATLIAECYRQPQFAYHDEVLYEQEENIFFIYREDGCLTRFNPISMVACSDDDWEIESQSIIPCSKSEAKSWFEKNIEPDAYVEEYEALFGEVQ